jgi:hypothetical protein
VNFNGQTVTIYYKPNLYNKIQIMRNSIKIISLILLLTLTHTINACTIFCGKDRFGHVWAGNNEDNAFSFANYINVFPKTVDTKYGYYTLSYHTPENGENVLIQGGMNEVGLFYDMNTLDMSGKEYIIKDLHKKKSFPQGDDAILSYILANFHTVEEVVAFFNEYWFDIGFKGAQIHLADKNGHFAMIDPTGSKVVTDKSYQLSTNFSICSNEETYGCWRYPIAKEELESREIGLATSRDICEKTSQKGYNGNYTIYSNIQNLSTGDIWFYFLSDYKNQYKTSISELLSKGRKSYLIRNLFEKHPMTILYNDFIEKGGQSAFETYEKLDLSVERKNEILSIFVTYFIGNEFNLEALPFLEEYLKTDPVGHWMTGAQAISYFNQGNKIKATEIIKDYKRRIPETSMDVNSILDKFNGIFPKDVNCKIELNGYQDAKNVFVTGLTGGIYDFMIKKDGKWTTELLLPDGIYNYQFVVDGKKVLDSETPIYTNANAFSTDVTKSHRISKNMSVNIYQKTIRVIAPDKDDEIYIAGNQSSLTNWNSVFRLKKISDYEREITVDLYLPAMLKFTKGNWDTEAVVRNYPLNESNQSYPAIVIDENWDNKVFEIQSWKNEN